MKVYNFYVKDGFLVGFAWGTTGRTYWINWHIQTFRSDWEKEGITLNDFLDNKAYVETNIRNRFMANRTKFIKRKRRF